MPEIQCHFGCRKNAPNQGQTKLSEKQKFDRISPPTHGKNQGIKKTANAVLKKKV